MIYSLLHGDVVAAARFNVVALVGLALLIVAFAIWTYGRAVDREIVSWQHHRWAGTVTLAVVGVWFVVRLLPFEPFAELRV